MNNATALLELVDRLHAARQLTHLAELAAGEACDTEMSRDAMSTTLVEIQNRIDAVADELKQMVQG
jgi:hypothetical protein